MLKEEIDFPRGGKKGNTNDNKQEGKTTTVTGTKKDKKEKQQFSRKRQNADESPFDRPLKKFKKADYVNVEGLLQTDALCTDLVVLTCVTEVHPHHISVSIPGNQRAIVPITNISEEYSQQLNRLSLGDELDETQDVVSAAEFFKPGFLFPVAVKSMEENKGGKHKTIIGSCKPADINGGAMKSEIQHGMLLMGNVSSVEDHGYRIDTGIKGLQAFLKYEDAASYITKYRSGENLSVGQPLWYVVNQKDKKSLTESENRVVNVSIDPELVQNSRLPKNVKLNSLLPGMKVTAHVKTVGAQGLLVTFGTFEGILNGSHLPLDVLSYTVGQAIDAAILYVHPESKTIHLSGLSQIVNQNGCTVELFTGVELGDIIQAKIHRVVKKKGLYLKMSKGKLGFAALSQLTDDSTVPDINNFEADQSVTCRVLGFNHLEGLLLVTLKKSILEQKFITVASLKPGEIVEATIVDVLPTGVFVKISNKIHSYISNIHMANVPITDLSKKFESGMTIKCRVTDVDVTKSRVRLTHKSALLKTKHIIPTDYTQLSPNLVVMGYITVIKDTFLIVNFFNGVHGIVVSSEMGLEKDQSSNDLFYKGQVVRCRVINFNADNEKLRLSFSLTPKVEKAPKTRKIEEPLNLSAGMVCKAKIVGIYKNSYRVMLMPSKYPAYLPFDQLSDYADIQELKKMNFAKGHVLPKVTFFNRLQHCIVTMKESFIRGAEDKCFAQTINDLEVGMLLPGVVKNHHDYGFFVEVAGGLTGLCPAKTLPAIEPSALKDLYPDRRSVLIRIVRIDKEKKRFLGAISKQDCIKYGEEDPVKFLQEYLNAKRIALEQMAKLDDKLKPYCGFSVGSLVEVTVTNVHAKGLLCKLPSGLQAIVTEHHLGGLKPQTGEQYSAVVLDVDAFSPCLELTMDPKLCKAVKSRTENTSTEVKMGQTLKAELLFMKQEFLLMKLKGHGTGKFVYIPTKLHFNDGNVPLGYEIGMYSDVIIKGNVGELFIGYLKTKEGKSFKKEVKEKTKNNDKLLLKVANEVGKENVDVRNLPLHDVQVGDIIEAKVKSVYPLQMNIVSDRVHGRVHITEVSDSVAEGKNPLHLYHGGDKVKVKVIGLRNMAMSKERYMPITKPRVSRTLLECTLKESKMDKTDPKILLDEELSTIVGAEIPVFVIQVDEGKLWVQASLKHQGFVSIFHVSKNVSVINNVTKRFKIGQALKATVIGKTNDDKINFSLTGEDVTPEIGSDVTALITGVKSSKSLSVKLSNGSVGVLNTSKGVRHSVGQYIRCRIASMSKKGLYKLSMEDKINERKRKSSLTLPEKEQVAEKVQKMDVKDLSNANKKVVEQEVEHSEKKDSVVKEVKNTTQKVKKKAKKSAEKKKEVNEDKQLELNVEKQEKSAESKKNRLTIEGFAWGGELDIKSTKKEVSDDDTDDETKNTVSDKFRKKGKRHQEEMIEKYERQQMKGTSGPQNENDFDRLVLQSPNSSVVWLAYMAYHLELGEVAKARAVAEKALETIVFREEQEKKNVWLAYLNLEAMYGDSEDLKNLLQRAVTYNDPLDIHLKMCDIFISANKFEDAEQQYNLLMKKFKKEKMVWKSYAQFLYKQDRHDAARNLLKRCLTALEKRDHVEVISRFAILEFTYGNPERGRTMFENLIASYPGRTDIWSVYIDMVVKSGDVVDARQLLMRAVKQKLNSKKLSFLIQKFIKFEETHGTEDEVQKVKDMAVNLFDTS